VCRFLWIGNVVINEASIEYILLETYRVRIHHRANGQEKLLALDAEGELAVQIKLWLQKAEHVDRPWTLAVPGERLVKPKG
jgi:hypothetical protein